MAFQVVDEFANFIQTKVVNVSSDTFKWVLTNTAPTKAGTQVIGDITQIAGTGGYAPVAATGVVIAETGAASGIWQVTCDPFSWTASGAAFASARYAALYDDTAANDCVVGFIDMIGSSFALADGGTLTGTPGANGVYRTTVS